MARLATVARCTPPATSGRTRTSSTAALCLTDHTGRVVAVAVTLDRRSRTLLTGQVVRSASLAVCQLLPVHPTTHAKTDLTTLRASCGAVYCNRSCLLVCVCVWVDVCVCVCGSVTTITRNNVHQSSPNWICR